MNIIPDNRAACDHHSILLAQCWYIWANVFDIPVVDAMEYLDKHCVLGITKDMYNFGSFHKLLKDNIQRTKQT